MKLEIYFKMSEDTSSDLTRYYKIFLKFKASSPCMFSMTKVIHSKSNAFSINAIFNWFLNLFNQILDQDLEPRRSRCGFKRKKQIWIRIREQTECGYGSETLAFSNITMAKTNQKFNQFEIFSQISFVFLVNI